MSVLPFKVTAARTALEIPGFLDRPIDRDIRKMVLGDQLISEDIEQIITDGEIIETTAGAASITLNTEDPKRKLQNGLLKQWVKMNPTLYAYTTSRRKKVAIPGEWDEIYGSLDGRDYALAGVTKNGNEFDLTLENRAINELRKYRKHRIWYRDAFTRAMVIKATCDEVKGYHIPFYSPELHKVQPITTAASNLTTSETSKLMKSGFGKGAKVTVKGASATAQQLSYISRVLRVGESMNASYRVLVSSIMCITQESDVTVLTDPSTGVGLFSQIPADGWPSNGSDIEAGAAAYFKKAIQSDQQSPTQPLTALVQSVQRSAFPNAYAQWQTEATNTVNVWAGGGLGSTGASATFQEFNRYAFERGANGQQEDSWTFDQRLAQEVQWYLFMLDNTLYYVDANDLLKQKPYDTISEKADGIDEINWDIDTGKKVATVTVVAHIERWTTPPGCVVVVEDSGPADGRWLVQQCRWPLRQSLGEVTLELPTPPKPEPSPSTTSVTISGQGAGSPGFALGVASGVVGAVAAATALSSMRLPYSKNYRTLTKIPPSQGYDCSAGVSWVLLSAGFSLPGGATWNSWAPVSGAFESWGDPGRGKTMTVWANADHIFIEFTGSSTTFFDSGHPSSERVWYSNPGAQSYVDSGAFTPRHWPGT